MAAKKIKIDNASFKFKKQTQRREQKVCLLYTSDAADEL